MEAPPQYPDQRSPSVRLARRGTARQHWCSMADELLCLRAELAHGFVDMSFASRLEALWQVGEGSQRASEPANIAPLAAGGHSDCAQCIAAR